MAPSVRACFRRYYVILGAPAARCRAVVSVHTGVRHSTCLTTDTKPLTSTLWRNRRGRACVISRREQLGWIYTDIIDHDSTCNATKNGRDLLLYLDGVFRIHACHSAVPPPVYFCVYTGVRRIAILCKRACVVSCDQHSSQKHAGYVCYVCHLPSCCLNMRWSYTPCHIVAPFLVALHPGLLETHATPLP